MPMTKTTPSKTVILSVREMLFREDGGQDLVEYALLAAVVAIGAVTALVAFQGVIASA